MTVLLSPDFSSWGILYTVKEHGERMNIIIQIIEKEEKAYIKFLYDINEEEAYSLINAKYCHLCGTEDRGNVWNEWHIDHDHKTGEVRGALCHGCNIGLGGFKDNIDILNKAIEYLVREVD